MSQDLPRIACRLTFLCPDDGGRERPVCDDPNYRPHLVVEGDPESTFLGVQFTGEGTELVPGFDHLVHLVLAYWPDVDYRALVPGARFTVREGGRVVGSGVVVEHSPGRATQFGVRLVVLAVLAHLLFGLQRVPAKALPKRLAQIRDYRTRGDIGFHVGRLSPESVPAVELLRARTPPDSVVLFDGQWRGAMELASALLHPRLFLRRDAVGKHERTAHGRPLARATLPGLGTGTLVLVGDADRLRLELQ
ncbi:MAG: hypothetical protein KDC87_06100 [Planctomycetes bacterium]|nr:hypothetical protein [Planctomycetota bacterium]